MEFLFLGLALGAIIAYFLYARFARRGSKAKVHSQSMVLMERIRSVCKFITVEGDFAEIYHYENLKDKWIQKLLGTKKALVLIDAKAHIGFDLTKIKMEANEEKQHIVDKIPNSGLYKQASQQALDTIILIQKLVETIGWQLNYDALKITSQEEPPKLNS